MSDTDAANLPADDAKRLEQTLIAHQVRWLYAGGPLTVGTNGLVSLVFAGVLFHLDGNPAYGAWLAGSLLVGLIRLVSFYWRARDPERLSDHDWRQLYRFGALAAGLLWTAAIFRFLPELGLAERMFATIILTGIATGAMATLLPDFPTYRLYVLSVLLPLGAIMIHHGSGIDIGTGLLALLLAVFLLVSSRRGAQAIAESIALRFRNEQLILDLQYEKQRLVSEAEGIVGTILANVPLTIWTTDASGYVTYLDDRRIRHLPHRPLPALGDSILASTTTSGLAQLAAAALRGEHSVGELAFGDLPHEVHCTPRRDPDGRITGLVGVAIDVSEHKRQEAELARLAHYDELTGLANRALATDQMRLAFARAQRNDRLVAVCFLDLDNFKHVNDSMGHHMGDELLCQVAQRLSNAVRKSDLVARFGGDEFLVLLEDLNQEADAARIARHLLALFEQPFRLHGREIFATTSIGIALYPRDGDDPEQTLTSADAAMYEAKQAGRNSYRFYTPALRQLSERHLTIETELRRAIEREELSLVYQPQVDIHSHQLSGAEALLRWQSARLGAVPPDQFIPVAERAGLMPAIGEWVLRQACADAAGWLRAPGRFRLAVNVSPQQFLQADLAAVIERILHESGLPPQSLELEITEGLLMQDKPDLAATLERLHGLGLWLALDDFGTGYSALSYLHRFPLQTLKIDRAFIAGIGRDHNSETLVDAIVAMAQSLDMEVIAEGVETPEQLAYLESRQVRLVQGFLFSRPIPAGEMAQLLEHSEPLAAKA